MGDFRSYWLVKFLYTLHLSGWPLDALTMLDVSRFNAWFRLETGTTIIVKFQDNQARVCLVRDSMIRAKEPLPCQLTVPNLDFAEVLSILKALGWYESVGEPRIWRSIGER